MKIGNVFKNGDKLTMELNCIDRSLNYHVNGNTGAQFGYKYIPMQGKTFTMAVSLSFIHDSVACHF